jgi:hypothetical protein
MSTSNGPSYDQNVEAGNCVQASAPGPTGENNIASLGEGQRVWSWPQRTLELTAHSLGRGSVRFRSAAATATKSACTGCAEHALIPLGIKSSSSPVVRRDSAATSPDRSPGSGEGGNQRGCGGLLPRRLLAGTENAGIRHQVTLVDGSREPELMPDCIRELTVDQLRPPVARTLHPEKAGSPGSPFGSPTDLTRLRGGVETGAS